jgi:hypothetical protein
MTFKAWIIELLKDERGGTSIKPVIVLIGTLVLCTTLLLQATIEGFVPSDNIVNAIMIITGIGMGADTMDKFSYKPKYNFKEEDKDEGITPPEKP